MATLASALLKAIRAQDDEFAKAILLRESLTEIEIWSAVEEMSEEECDNLYDVLVRLSLQDPRGPRPERWFEVLKKRNYEGKDNSKEALETLREYEIMLEPKISELHKLTTTCLENVISKIQTDAIRAAKNNLSRGTRNSQPLLKYTVKH